MPRLLCIAALSTLAILLPGLSRAADGTWSPLRPPARRYDAAAVYDPAGDRLVVVGGWLGAAQVNDVWVRGLGPGSSWQLLTMSSPPSARSGHTVIYDSVRSRLILFGGQDNNAGMALNDVWVAALGPSPGWTQLAPTGTPPPGRAGHVAVYDAASDRMIVFGGTNATTPELNDAWALTLSGTPAWQDLHANGAPSRKGASAIHDPVGGRMLVFGGSVGSTQMNDVWQLTL